MGAWIMIPPEVIIIHGGDSLKSGISRDLQKRIQNRFVITINYSYSHFPNATFLTFMDRSFYCPSLEDISKGYKNTYEDLKSLPLIIGTNADSVVLEKKLPNTYIVPFCPFKLNKKDALTKGFYSAPGGGRTGVFALSLALFLTDYKGKIFCLGLDYGLNKNSNNLHYYPKSEILHRGSDSTKFYDNHSGDEIYKPFLPFKNNIYNVSPNSNLNLFKKIDYQEFFSKLGLFTYNQDFLRRDILIKLGKFCPERA
jgi:hypothetical protein